MDLSICLAHGNFIREDSEPYDWRVNQDRTLWANESSTNNPCPQGYRVPTRAEQNALVTAASITNYTNAASSNLAFSAPGGRNYSTATLNSHASFGRYWSSSVSGSYVYLRHFYSSGTDLNTVYRGYGFSVRCLKD